MRSLARVQSLSIQVCWKKGLTDDDDGKKCVVKGQIQTTIGIIVAYQQINSSFSFLEPIEYEHETYDGTHSPGSHCCRVGFGEGRRRSIRSNATHVEISYYCSSWNMIIQGVFWYCKLFFSSSVLSCEGSWNPYFPPQRKKLQSKKGLSWLLIGEWHFLQKKNIVGEKNKTHTF